MTRDTSRADRSSDVVHRSGTYRGAVSPPVRRDGSAPDAKAGQ
jgi:hypothetical protein